MDRLGQVSFNGLNRRELLGQAGLCGIRGVLDDDGCSAAELSNSIILNDKKLKHNNNRWWTFNH